MTGEALQSVALLGKYSQPHFLSREFFRYRRLFWLRWTAVSRKKCLLTKFFDKAASRNFPVNAQNNLKVRSLCELMCLLVTSMFNHPLNKNICSQIFRSKVGQFWKLHGKLPTIIHKIFEKNSSFHVKQCTMGKVQFLFFRSILLDWENICFESEAGH